MKPSWKDRSIAVRAFAHNIAYSARGMRLALASHKPAGEAGVPPDFFGICVASAPDAASDDYVVARLRELGARCARVDIMRDGNGFQERLLERLMDEGFDVCMHLVQPAEEARNMADAAARERWRSFVAAMLEKHGGRAGLVEIGSVCNRRKWSGYTIASFLLSWRTAWEEAERRNIALAGPNVTDFEPVYNVSLLGEMKRRLAPPAAHTDNLFVERAREPEAFDHKIMGRRLSGVPGFNLVKKAAMLADISEWAGVRATICTHVSWSLRRIGRLCDNVEEKQADYLARYCCLAAASGALRRVYWGPMIGQREGLIDDGTSEFPEVPHVAFYGTANGRISDYRVRPAFSAFRTVNRLIAGAVFKRKYPSAEGLEILEFESPERLVHAVWTMDGLRAAASDCYEPDALRGAAAFSRGGSRLEGVPPLFSESPVYITWPPGARLAARKNAAPIPRLRFAGGRETSFATIDDPPWSGAALAGKPGSVFDIGALVGPVRAEEASCRDGDLGSGGGTEVFRRTRNLVWSAPAPWDRRSRVVIKRFKPISRLRMLLEPRKPDKAQRSWNNSQELIRRGIATPLPIAFFHKHSGGRECYFVCEEWQDAVSVRDAFAAFSAGADSFLGKTASEFFRSLARFLLKMHERGVFFRDLSAGNVLFRATESGKAEFALIDTARARFHPQRLGLMPRLCDLMRICHPLHWPGREEFAGTYMNLGGRRFGALMRIPFAYYDVKHRAKNALKPLRLKKKSAHLAD